MLSFRWQNYRYFVKPPKKYAIILLLRVKSSLLPLRSALPLCLQRTLPSDITHQTSSMHSDATIKSCAMLPPWGARRTLEEAEGIDEVKCNAKTQTQNAILSKHYSSCLAEQDLKMCQLSVSYDILKLIFCAVLPSMAAFAELVVRYS